MRLCACRTFSARATDEIVGCKQDRVPTAKTAAPEENKCPTAASDWTAGLPLSPALPASLA
jgi:hypothetical protein